MLVPYLILIKAESGDPSNFGFLWLNLSHTFIFAIFIIIASEYFDQGALLSMADLFTYMVTLAAYSCLDSLYYCYEMCEKAES